MSVQKPHGIRNKTLAGLAFALMIISTNASATLYQLDVNASVTVAGAGTTSYSAGDGVALSIIFDGNAVDTSGQAAIGAYILGMQSCSFEVAGAPLSCSSGNIFIDNLPSEDAIYFGDGSWAIRLLDSSGSAISDVALSNIINMSLSDFDTADIRFPGNDPFAEITEISVTRYSVPEPAITGFLILGVAGLTGRRVRRFRKEG